MQRTFPLGQSIHASDFTTTVGDGSQNFSGRMINIPEGRSTDLDIPCEFDERQPLAPTASTATVLSTEAEIDDVDELSASTKRYSQEDPQFAKFVTLTWNKVPYLFTVSNSTDNSSSSIYPWITQMTNQQKTQLCDKQNYNQILNETNKIKFKKYIMSEFQTNGSSLVVLHCLINAIKSQNIEFIQNTFGNIYDSNIAPIIILNAAKNKLLDLTFHIALYSFLKTPIEKGNLAYKLLQIESFQSPEILEAIVAPIVSGIPFTFYLEHNILESVVRNTEYAIIHNKSWSIVELCLKHFIDIPIDFIITVHSSLRIKFLRYQQRRLIRIANLILKYANIKQFDKVDFLFSNLKELSISYQNFHMFETDKIEEITIYNQVIQYLKKYCKYNRNPAMTLGLKYQVIPSVDPIHFTGNYPSDITVLFDKLHSYVLAFKQLQSEAPNKSVCQRIRSYLCCC